MLLSIMQGIGQLLQQKIIWSTMSPVVPRLKSSGLSWYQHHIVLITVAYNKSWSWVVLISWILLLFFNFVLAILSPMNFRIINLFYFIYLFIYLFTYLLTYLFCFLGPHPRHMDVPRLGVQPELQLPAHTTATAVWDPSCVCNYTTACGSARSLTHWAWPGIKPTTLGFLVGFVSTAVQ